DWGARSSANTAPAPTTHTSPVTGEPMYYQHQPPPMAHIPMQPPPFVAPRSKSPLVFFLIAVGAAVFVMILVVVMFVARQARLHAGGGGGPIPPQSLQQGEQQLTDNNSDQVDLRGNETTYVKLFDLDGDARVSVSNINGDVTVTAWDKQKAEVRAIKNGSEADRVATPIIFKSEGGNLTIRTGRNPRSNVRYEIRLPREVGHLELSTVNGMIKLSDLSGDVSTKSVNGSLNLTNIEGSLQAETTNGTINATVTDLSDKNSSFKNVNGSINLQVKGNLNAQLDAESVHGSIIVDDSFGIPIEKNIVGQKARGTIGGGGPALAVRTVNGSIKLTK